MSNSFQPHELQHTRPPCQSPTPGVHPNSCSLSQWCHPTISSSVIPFSSCPQSLTASGSFQMSQLFASGGQSIGVSASTSVLPMNTQGWSPLGWTGWISLQSKWIPYKTLYSILLGHFTLHFRPQFHQEVLPQITICLVVCCCWVAKLCLILCDNQASLSTRFPGKNTGVGRHFLLWLCS